MTQIALPTGRFAQAWLRLPFSKHRIPLITNIEVEKELWSTLEYYSEVEEVGIDLMQERGLPEPLLQETYKYFQAFIRQAKSYYT